MKSKGTSSHSSASNSTTGRARNGKNGGAGNGHGPGARGRGGKAAVARHAPRGAPIPPRDGDGDREAELLLKGQPPIEAYLADGEGDGDDVTGGRFTRRAGGRNGNGNGNGHHDDEQLDKMTLLKALMAFKKGDFSARLPV